MLSNKQIICPNNLLDASIKKKGATAAIVNAGKPLPMQSVMDAVKEDLIKPIFIGDKDQIQKCANEIQFDISGYEVIHEPLENNTVVPFSRTNLGEPEFNSKTEWENTLPLSEPGELTALELLETVCDSISSTSSKSTEESKIPITGTSKKRRHILIARVFREY